MPDSSHNWRDDSQRLVEISPAQVVSSSARHARFVISSMQTHIKRLEAELQRHEAAMARLARAVEQTDVLSTASLAELYRVSSELAEPETSLEGQFDGEAPDDNGPMC